ncbi:low molecular weight protein-tyrosine-phosphatase [Maricaulis sp.]|uniref:low molecular weight protein-tyrosine-phosphatase n=1 Tax=Maricaulis sp. TaxID=1486257 RepID=UPI0025B8F31C|nr:low molecular weight protein-tyrosine-phosphatase [Maricaulis sp.]
MRLLFVCTGNICRSPTAEAVARARIEALGLDWSVDSAGTSGWHEGEPPDPRSQAAAAARGYSFDGLAARALVAEDFTRFDNILAMDSGHDSHLRRLAPPGVSGRISRLMDWAPDKQMGDVPDPYYGTDAGFEDVLDLVEAGVDGLIAALRAQPGQASG